MIDIVMPRHPFASRACPCTVVLPRHRGERRQRTVQDIITIDTMSVTTRIFPTAQTREPTLFVPSAWAPTCTTSMHARHPRHGMGNMQHLSKETRMSYTCERAIPQSASTGSKPEVAPATNTTADMFALDAVKPLMELVLVLKCRRLKALTPYHLDVWERKLQEAGLTGEYPHVVAGLCFSFSINFPKVTSRHPLINVLSSSSQKSFPELLVRKFRKEATLDQFHDGMSSLSLALFKLPPFQLSLNLGNLINIEIFKTIHSRLILPSFSQILQLIRVLIPVFSLVNV